jgi:hypothetical protein
VLLPVDRSNGFRIDLHGGCFHFLSAIYSVFYGALLQPIQSVLGWKRIKGNDVTKCYQQAAGLALLVGTEIDRLLIALYIHEVITGKVPGDIVPDNEELNDNLAIILAQGFIKWKVKKGDNTNDDYLKMIITFSRLLEMYRLFRLSIRAGDAIMIEHLYCEFLPIFAVTGKTHCVESVISGMEHLYCDLSPKLLHLVRINRTQPLYDGCDKSGNPMANWSLDGIIELIQKFYHQMKFQNTDIGWLNNSPHVMLMNKAQRFAGDEYQRRNMKDMLEELDMDKHCEQEGTRVNKKDPNKKATIIPNRAKEHYAVAEFLTLIGAGVEVQNRKFSKKHVWSTLEKITTVLKDDSTEEEIQKTVKKELSLTAEELLLNEITDAIFEKDCRQSDSDGLQHDVGGSDGNHADESDDDLSSNVNINNVSEEDKGDSNEIMFKVGTNRCVRVRRAKVNNQAFSNVFLHGTEILRKKNLTITRYRRNERKKREQNIRESVYHAVTTGSGTTAGVEWLEDAFSRIDENTNNER